MRAVVMISSQKLSFVGAGLMGPRPLLVAVVSPARDELHVVRVEHIHGRLPVVVLDEGCVAFKVGHQLPRLRIVRGPGRQVCRVRGVQARRKGDELARHDGIQLRGLKGPRYVEIGAVRHSQRDGCVSGRVLEVVGPDLGRVVRL